MLHEVIVHGSFVSIINLLLVLFLHFSMTSSEMTYTHTSLTHTIYIQLDPSNKTMCFKNRLNLLIHFLRIVTVTTQSSTVSVYPTSSSSLLPVSPSCTHLIVNNQCFGTGPSSTGAFISKSTAHIVDQPKEHVQLLIRPNYITYLHIEGTNTLSILIIYRPMIIMM